MIAIGIVFIALGIVFAGVALFTEEWRQGVKKEGAFERAVVVGGLVVSGFLAGSPFIVFGQLLTIFLEQRALLARIHRRLGRGEQGPRADAGGGAGGRDRYPRLG